MLQQTGVQLEKIIMGDRDEFVMLVSNPKLSGLMSNGEAWQPEYAGAVFDRMLAEQRRHNLSSRAVKIAGALVGTVMLEQAGPHTVEVTCWVAPAYQCYGLASAALHELLSELSSSDYDRLVARCRVENQAARRLAEKVGLKAVGVDSQRFGDGVALLFELQL